MLELEHMNLGVEVGKSAHNNIPSWQSNNKREFIQIVKVITKKCMQTYLND